MSKTKTAKTTKGSRKSQPKYLGVKKFGGEKVSAGTILIRQRGTKYQAGSGVSVGRDHTLFAVTDGVVTYYERLRKKFVSITPAS